MKKIAILMIVIFICSSFAIAASDDTSEPECGILCKVNEFFFGSSEVRNAAGSAWFDRNENIVGN